MSVTRQLLEQRQHLRPCESLRGSGSAARVHPLDVGSVEEVAFAHSADANGCTAQSLVEVLSPPSEGRFSHLDLDSMRVASPLTPVSVSPQMCAQSSVVKASLPLLIRSYPRLILHPLPRFAAIDHQHILPHPCPFLQAKSVQVRSFKYPPRGGGWSRSILLWQTLNQKRARV